MERGWLKEGEAVTHLHAAAQRLVVERGWSVFPLSGKVPATVRGFHDASRDKGQVDFWWYRQPFANVGLPTGRTNGFWVLDLDLKADANGVMSAQLLEQEFGVLPMTMVVRTGTGGLHMYWSHPPDLVLKNRQNVRPGVDVRGDGGYVVAPPSTHPDTLRPYRVVCEAPIVPAPQWLVDLVAPPKPKPLPQPAPKVRLHADEYDREKLRRLREDPGTRQRLGEACGGKVRGTGSGLRVDGVTCVQCGRPSVWWAIYPHTSSKAFCDHRNSCGWSGGLEEYL